MAGKFDPTPIEHRNQLLDPFVQAEKPRSDWRVGTEAEKFGILQDDSPIQYLGPNGVRQILAELAQRHGWFEVAEYEGGDVISLKRGNASITLEPGGQFELSGAPHSNIHHTCAEFRGHMAELRDISDDLGIRWLGLGFHPLATQEQLPWVPKMRYGIMKDYLPTRGSMARDMMRRTATVQANYDFSDETDALRKLRIGLRVQPIITAMFANSPWREGKAIGERSHRAKVWLNVDPDRSGLLPFAWKKGIGYEEYVDWVLDVPMFMVTRGAKVYKNTGQTFRAFLKDGFEGVRATKSDWETHVNTMFPEVRLKNIIEVRGADNQNTDLICALPALWKGILYDAQALDLMEELTDELDYETVEQTRPEIAKSALMADLAGRKVVTWAEQVLDIAKGGLGRISHLNRHGEDETIHLSRLSNLVEHGQSPADALLAAVDPKAELKSEIIRLSEMTSSAH